MKKHSIELSKEQRQELEAIVRSGKTDARSIQHAHILLHSDSRTEDPVWSEVQLAEAYEVSERTVWRVRRRFHEQGLHNAVYRRPQPERPEKRKINGVQEAFLIAMCCGPAPDGYARWSVRLLTDTFVVLEEDRTTRVPIGRETIRRTLSTLELKPWRRAQWCVPRRGGGQWVACMEDVLDVYHRPYEPRRPQICVDECGKQLLTSAVQGEPMKPGKPERFDYHYERHGVCSVFLASEPLAGKRVTQVRAQRTRQDFAHFIKELVDVHYADAEKLVLVMDNLNTHTIGSLYETFEPEEAHRLSHKLEIHHTPTYASWLNIAEIELSILSSQCLDRRMGSLEEVQQEVMAWQIARNRAQKGVDWRFTTSDARIKLKRLYPTVK